MLHYLRRKVKIENLCNVEDTARAQGLDLAFAFATTAKTPPADTWSQTRSQTTLGSHLPNTSDYSLKSSLEHTDIQLEATPQFSGLDVYVKGKIKELIRRLPLE